MTLEIIYEDEHLIAINKPPGLLVHRSDLDQEKTDFAVTMLSSQIDAQVWPAHRLDKGTSGVLLFARTRESISRTATLFQEGKVKKRYLALVRGFSEAGEIQKPVKARKDKFITSERTQWDALTVYETLARVEIPFPVDIYPTSRYSLIAFYPRTGRRHQIRQHARSLKHPIVGDRTYGQRVHNDFFRDHYQCPRLFLAAVSLTLPHPFTEETLTIGCDPGPEFNEMIARFWPGKKFH